MPRRPQLSITLVLLGILWVVGITLFAVIWWLPWFALSWTGVVCVVGALLEDGLAGDRQHISRRMLESEARSSMASGGASRRPRVPTPPSADTQRVASSFVAIAGVGDIGSRVAVTLAQSSVARLAVADIDVVEMSNIGQSAFRAIDVGESKVDAVEQLCREIAPHIQVRRCEADLRKVPEFELAMWLGGASVLILSVDDPPALLRLHDLFYARVPIVASGIHDGGASGHVVYTIPGKTPCLRCALDIGRAGDLVQVRGNSASADDVQRIAGETASVALTLLDPARSRGLQAGRNLLFITNRGSDGTDSRQSAWLEAPRKARCPICRGGGGM
jgi:molybdopterin/thiamine biosynthesis adenylyltransferase